MVLIISDKHVEGDISAEKLFTDFPDLRSHSEALLRAAPRIVRAEERHVYVGQREMAVSERGDMVEILGSEDATTCHIVILRDLSSDRGVTGLGHLDSEDPGQLLALEAAVRQRVGSAGPWEYEVSLVGGYNDDRSCSRDITDSLLFTMQVWNVILSCVYHHGTIPESLRRVPSEPGLRPLSQHGEEGGGGLAEDLRGGGQPGHGRGLHSSFREPRPGRGHQVSGDTEDTQRGSNV